MKWIQTLFDNQYNFGTWQFWFQHFYKNWPLLTIIKHIWSWHKFTWSHSSGFPYIGNNSITNICNDTISAHTLPWDYEYLLRLLKKNHPRFHLTTLLFDFTHGSRFSPFVPLTVKVKFFPHIYQVFFPKIITYFIDVVFFKIPTVILSTVSFDYYSIKIQSILSNFIVEFKSAIISFDNPDYFPIK